ncbi:hypothetical protein C8J57DRAFT_1062861, partial [Mycena rebaudengoi]
YKGLLFGAGASSPQIVSVPLRLGLSELRTIDDVDSGLWLPVGSHVHCSGLDLDHTTCTIKRWPLYGAEELTSFYTFFATRQTNIPLPQPPVNTLIGVLFPFASPWRGNILVLRHRTRNGASMVEDLCPDDILLVKDILEG